MPKSHVAARLVQCAWCLGHQYRPDALKVTDKHDLLRSWGGSGKAVHNLLRLCTIILFVLFTRVVCLGKNEAESVIHRLVTGSQGISFFICPFTVVTFTLRIIKGIVTVFRKVFIAYFLGIFMSGDNFCCCFISQWRLSFTRAAVRAFRWHVKLLFSANIITEMSRVGRHHVSG